MEACNSRPDEPMGTANQSGMRLRGDTKTQIGRRAESQTVAAGPADGVPFCALFTFYYIALPLASLHIDGGPLFSRNKDVEVVLLHYGVGRSE